MHSNAAAPGLARARLLIRRKGELIAMFGGYRFYEGRAMVRLRGAVGIIGLLAIAVAFVASETHVAAQREPSYQLLEERGKDASERIKTLEQSALSVATRLTRIETELEIARRVSESNGQMMTGLVVGIALILAERLFVLFGYLARRKKDVPDD
jgi:hypothetical protein